MSWAALKKRYTAGIKAVEEGADPALTLSYVLWPTLAVHRASRGELPQGWHYLTEAERRRYNNERNRRYNQPAQKRWHKEAA